MDSEKIIPDPLIARIVSAAPELEIPPIEAKHRTILPVANLRRFHFSNEHDLHVDNDDDNNYYDYNNYEI